MSQQPVQRECCFRSEIFSNDNNNVRPYLGGLDQIVKPCCQDNGLGNFFPFVNEFDTYPNPPPLTINSP
jgi:hypothetical protein